MTINERSRLAVLVIERVAAGRYGSALDLLADLAEDPAPPVTLGQCRFCGCTDAAGCCILTPDPLGIQDARTVRCQWADVEQTVCTNLACLNAWRVMSQEALQTSATTLNDPDTKTRIIVP